MPVKVRRYSRLIAFSSNAFVEIFRALLPSFRNDVEDHVVTHLT